MSYKLLAGLKARLVRAGETLLSLCFLLSFKHTSKLCIQHKHNTQVLPVILYVRLPQAIITVSQTYGMSNKCILRWYDIVKRAS